MFKKRTFFQVLAVVSLIGLIISGCGKETPTGGGGSGGVTGLHADGFIGKIAFEVGKPEIDMASIDIWKIEDGDTLSVSGATVFIYAGDDTIHLSEVDSGYYNAYNPTVNYNTQYSLYVKTQDDKTITALTKVPGSFTITSPANGATVPIGQPITVTWTQIQSAENVVVGIGDYGAEMGIGDYYSDYLPGTATSHTIPGSAVVDSGECQLFVYGGINCDTTAAGNLNGAEGCFAGISAYGIMIIVQ